MLSGFAVVGKELKLQLFIFNRIMIKPCLVTIGVEPRQVIGEFNPVSKKLIAAPDIFPPIGVGINNKIAPSIEFEDQRASRAFEGPGADQAIRLAQVVLPEGTTGG